MNLRVNKQLEMFSQIEVFHPRYYMAYEQIRQDSQSLVGCGGACTSTFFLHVQRGIFLYFSSCDCCIYFLLKRRNSGLWGSVGMSRINDLEFFPLYQQCSHKILSEEPVHVTSSLLFIPLLILKTSNHSVALQEAQHATCRFGPPPLFSPLFILLIYWDSTFICY